MLQNNPELRGKIDQLWNKFWSGGISNPLTAIEQITYLLFIRRLDDLQTLAEKKANRTRQPVESPMFLPGQAELMISVNLSVKEFSKPNLIGAVIYRNKTIRDGGTYSDVTTRQP